MAQFAVYRNRSVRTKALFPLLLDVQSDLLEDLQTRVVIPMCKPTTLARKPISLLMPVVKFEGETYILVTAELAGVAVSDLGAVAGSLAEHRDEIVAAMDFLVVGF